MPPTATSFFGPPALPVQGQAAAPAAEPRRLGWALLVSLAVHLLLASLSLGGQGPGLPGFQLPWQERRAEVPELELVLPAPQPPVPPPVLPPPEPPEPDKAAALPVQAMPSEELLISVPRTAPVPSPKDSKDPKDPKAPEPVPAPPPPTPAPPAPEAAPEPIVEPVVEEVPLPVLTLERPQAPRPLRAAALSSLRPLPAQSLRPPAALAWRPVEPSREDPERQARAAEAVRAEAARQEAVRLEAARQEAVRLEAARLEAARSEAARSEAARLEAARAEAARLEAARLAAAKAEAARQEAARLEAARAEAARLEAARAEAVRQEAARVAVAQAEAARQELARIENARAEAARLEAARQDAARQEAARIEAARRQAVLDEEERREAARRAMGRQLDEEAAQREAAAGAADNRPSSWSSLRRGRLFGRSDPNAELVQYAENWARKIQLNTALERLRPLLQQAPGQALVTVAIRRDGTVESVNFVVSSGLPALDEEIRRIVQGQAPYPAFPPLLAQEFDVIEIRRSWQFDSAIRLY